MTMNKPSPTGLDACFQDDAGTTIVPATAEEWQGWVAASATRNWCGHDGLIDWLNRYGDAAGFVRDPDPDPRTDWLTFIFGQGQEFEEAILAELDRRVGIFRLAGDPASRRSVEACEATVAALRAGEPIVAQGVLRNPTSRTFGAADLLIRSDVLRDLFPESITADEATAGAPGLGAGRWHYRVLDVKFSTLKLGKAGCASAGSHLAYMVQVFLYNRALGRIQGYLPPESYLLGRGWKQGDERGKNALERLACVPDASMTGRETLAVGAAEAVDWVRRLRAEGDGWDPYSEDCPDELLPSLPGDQPWHNAVALIAERRADVTVAWQVGRKGREQARAAGITRWTDPRFTAGTAGVTGVRAGTLDLMLAQNRDAAAPAIQPERITTEVDAWGASAGVEFFVDFETVNSLDDSFEAAPEQGGQPVIFMIGCGHLEEGKWHFRAFTAESLDSASEADIVEEWLGYMDEVRRRLAPTVQRPLVFHWSPAENVSLTSGYESARRRNPARSAAWREPNWFDFLNRVMKREPVTVKGPMGFGLKTVARSLKGHGLIETTWGDSVTDGLGAMVGAWWCSARAKERGCTVAEIDLMDEIRAYNEVDCKVMMEVICLLRGRVTSAGA